MKKALTFILLIIFFSCKKENNIKPKLSHRQPYKIGDKLIFKSSSNQIDTLFVNEISEYTTPYGNRGFLPEYQTTYFISGEITLQNPFISITGKKVTKEYISLLKLSTVRENDYITLTFKKRSDTLTYPELTFKISDLESKFEKKSKYESIKIDTESYEDLQFVYDLKNIYWSKEFGYTKYEFKNGYLWNLVKFIRNNENILKTK